MGEDKPSDREAQRRWHDIMRREQAKDEAADDDGTVMVERDGVVAMAADITEDDDEWVVMDDCPDDMQFGE